MDTDFTAVGWSTYKANGSDNIAYCVGIGELPIVWWRIKFAYECTSQASGHLVEGQSVRWLTSKENSGSVKFAAWVTDVSLMWVTSDDPWFTSQVMGGRGRGAAGQHMALWWKPLTGCGRDRVPCGISFGFGIQPFIHPDQGSDFICLRCYHFLWSTGLIHFQLKVSLGEATSGRDLYLSHIYIYIYIYKYICIWIYIYIYIHIYIYSYIYIYIYIYIFIYTYTSHISTINVNIYIYICGTH